MRELNTIDKLLNTMKLFFFFFLKMLHHFMYRDWKSWYNKEFKWWGTSPIQTCEVNIIKPKLASPSPIMLALRYANCHWVRGKERREFLIWITNCHIRERSCCFLLTRYTTSRQFDSTMNSNRPFLVASAKSCIIACTSMAWVRIIGEEVKPERPWPHHYGFGLPFPLLFFLVLLLHQYIP